MNNKLKAQHKKAPAGVILPIGALLTGMMISPLDARAAEETTLPALSVYGDRDSANNGYQGGTTRVGKIPQLPKDVPQALTIVSEQLMLDKNNHTLKEALGNVSGLTFNAGEGGRIGDNMNLRGFYSFGDLYLDGIRDVAQYNRETFNIEQIDVLRGSGSMLFGRGQAGGVINQVSKQAELVDKGSITATYGTQQYKRISTDLNHRLGENAALRINAVDTDAGSTRDHVSSQRQGIAPNIRWGIGTDNEFSLSYSTLRTHNIPDYGVPFFQQRPLNVPASRFYGTTSDYEDNTVDMTTGSYKHAFSNETELRSVLRSANYTRELWATQPQLRSVGNCTVGASTSVSDANCINRSIKARGGEEHTITSQTDLTTRFNTGALAHEALVGVELLREQASRWPYSTTGLTIPSTTVGNPDATPSNLDSRYGHREKGAITSYTGHSYGIYAQDSVEFSPGWKFLGGIRQDRLDAEYLGPTPGSANMVRFSQTSYRSGLMFQPSQTQSYYLAWNDSFNPTADLYQLDNGTNFDPERSQTVEIGGKWELFDGDLSLRTALYRAEKEWERNTDVESTGTLLSKKRRTDGLEVEAAGRLSQRWEVFGGIALMNAQILEPGYQRNNVTGVVTAQNPNLTGMRPRNAPRYTANLWTSYRLDGGWKVGLGANAVSERLAYSIGTGTSPISTSIAPAFVRWDALIAYEQKTYALKLNVNNLLNTRYYESIYENGGHAVPGTERAAQATLELKF
ncbi:MAG: TonB-dependent siderophore receptor [Pseudomonadota bacterium]